MVQSPRPAGLVRLRDRKRHAGENEPPLRKETTVQAMPMQSQPPRRCGCAGNRSDSGYQRCFSYFCSTWRQKLYCGSMTAQSAGEIHEFVLVQIRNDPICHAHPVPMEDVVALCVLLLDLIVGCALMGPHEHVNVV